MDTFELADMTGAAWIFLKVIDIASRFGLVIPLGSRRPMDVWVSFLTRWASWAGFLRRFLFEGGGELERESRQEAEALPAEVVTSAAQAPQQNSVAEGRGGVW